MKLHVKRHFACYRITLTFHDHQVGPWRKYAQSVSKSTSVRSHRAARLPIFVTVYGQRRHRQTRRYQPSEWRRVTLLVADHPNCTGPHSLISPSLRDQTAYQFQHSGSNIRHVDHAACPFDIRLYATPAKPRRDTFIVAAGTTRSMSLYFGDVLLKNMAHTCATISVTPFLKSLPYLTITLHFKGRLYIKNWILWVLSSF